MRERWNFTIFPITIIFIVSPLLILIDYFSDQYFHISGLGGYLVVVALTLFWSAPVYFFIFSLFQLITRQGYSFLFGLLALLLWIIGAVLIIVTSFGCAWGGCSQPLVIEFLTTIAFLGYLLSLFWLAHR